MDWDEFDGMIDSGALQDSDSAIAAWFFDIEGILGLVDETGKGAENLDLG